jgi:Spy/CpxP family protein refolding chaperone
MKHLVFGTALVTLVISGFAQAPATNRAVASPTATNRAIVAPPPPSRQAQEQQVLQQNLPSLNEEQRKKLQEASSKLQKEQSTHYQEMARIRRELDELTRAETIDEQALRAKAMEMGRIEGELAVLRAKHQKELRSILPKEHFERLQSGQPMRPQVQQRLNTIVERGGTNALNRPQPPNQGAPSAAAPTATRAQTNAPKPVQVQKQL